MGEMNRQSRRSILIAGASGVAAGLLARGGPMAVAAETSPASHTVDRGKAKSASIKLSLAGYSYRKHLDTLGKPGEMSLFDLVDLCAELGLDAVEPTSYYFLKLDDEFIYSVKRKIFLAGLANSGMPVRNNFALPDGPQFDNEVKQLCDWVDVAAKLGAPNMRIFAGSPSKTMSREQVFPQVVKGIRRACEYAGTKGVFLAIEDHGYMTETAEDVIRIVEGVNHPWLGVNLDTGGFGHHAYDQIRKLAPYAVVCQFKTMCRPGEPGRPGEPARQEHADYARIFQILRDARYRGYVALEYEGTDAKADVPKEIRMMQAALHG
ncbi:MAG: sugar phosphate isomerase/epimerase [Planctomycetes bacterium]|nr:sugar phosphate isomerase/epimerase [Planctomycetota bacterium]